MTTQEKIDFLLREIRRLGKQIRWLRKHQVKLEALPTSVTCGSEKVDFENLSHADVIKVIRAFGGKWKKEPIGDNQINYVTDIDGLLVRCWRGEPPPNCRVIEVEEMIPERVIPAQVIKRKKLVCQPAFAATIAMAAERGKNLF